MLISRPDVERAAFAKLYSSTLANNRILAGVQYIFIEKILPKHQPLSN